MQQRYAQYKVAFDRKDYQTASAGFNELLALYADPDLANAAGRPPLADLRVLIGGFYELSLQAIADATTQDYSFTPDDNGTYTVTFTVTDEDGGTDTATKVVTVTNTPPTAIPMSTRRRPTRPIAFPRRGRPNRSSTFPGKPPS